MRIKLENIDGRPDETLALCFSPQEARDDQSIMGSKWEVADGECAYAVISDEPELAEKLAAEGYEVDDSEYYPWEEENKQTLRSK